MSRADPCRWDILGKPGVVVPPTCERCGIGPCQGGQWSGPLLTDFRPEPPPVVFPRPEPPAEPEPEPVAPAEPPTAYLTIARKSNGFLVSETREPYGLIVDARQSVAVTPVHLAELVKAWARHGTACPATTPSG